ncbi:aldo/keto reductase [Candidatus Latescibacterota bacterium]
MKITNRRNFIKTGTAIAGLGLTASCSSSKKMSSVKGTVRYRDLGSTGFKTSEIGFGCMNMRNAELLHAAIDSGINYIDTAHSYMNGVNEEVVGSVMKTKRDQVFLTTKIRGGASELPGLITTSLKRLQTDRIDLLLLHVTSSREQLFNEDVMKVFEDAKRKGQTRFIGVSTHSNQAEVLNAAVDGKFWEGILTGYNYNSPPELTAAIKRAREAGIAIIGMKTLITTEKPRTPFPDIRKGKTDITNQQALLKWVLEDRYVDTIIPGITSFEQLADDVAIMDMNLAYDDTRIARRYSENTKGIYCCGVSGCTGCKEKCPNGVQVNELNRCLNYAEGYSDIELAMENYNALPASSRIEMCSDCDECSVKCVNEINITDNINRAKKLFA